MRHTPRTALAFALALGILGAPGVTLAQSASPAPSAPTGPTAPTTTLRLPRAPGPLPAGTYQTEALGPAMTFELGDGWQGTEGEGLFELFWSETPGYVGASTFTGVVSSDPCDPAVKAEVDPSAEAFDGWLTGLPALEVTATPTTFAGIPATRYDVHVAFMACPLMGHLSLWGRFGLYPTEALRVFAIDDGGQVILVTAESEQATGFESFLEVAQPVLDSMVIAGPALPPGVVRITA